MAIIGIIHYLYFFNNLSYIICFEKSDKPAIPILWQLDPSPHRGKVLASML